jgi:formate dehydrogenase iron-sulfur subunit
MNSIGILFDGTRCIGCLECVKLCKKEHDLPEKIETELSGRSLTVVQKKTDYFQRKLCMHCLHPACVSVCPVGALEKLENGPVVWDTKKCFGCRYCMVACPFGIPKYEWWEAVPKVKKCDYCQSNRLIKGEEPACSWVCPVGATMFGDREELIQEAHRRLKVHSEKYQETVYGETEVGGTSTLILLPFGAIDHGLPDNLPKEALPELTWAVMRKIPYVVVTGGVVLGGLWWVINRRMELAALTQEELAKKEGESK